MDDIQRDGYLAGFISLIITIIFALVGVKSDLSGISGQFIVILAIIFGGLTVGSLLRPDTIGQLAFEILKRLSENGRRNTRESNTESNTSGKNTTVIQHFEKVNGDVHTIAGSQNSTITKNVQNAQRRKVKKKTTEQIIRTTLEYYYDDDEILESDSNS